MHGGCVAKVQRGLACLCQRMLTLGINVGVCACMWVWAFFGALLLLKGNCMGKVLCLSLLHASLPPWMRNHPGQLLCNHVAALHASIQVLMGNGDVEMQLACVGVLLEVLQRYWDDAKLVEQVWPHLLCRAPQIYRGPLFWPLLCPLLCPLFCPLFCSLSPYGPVPGCVVKCIARTLCSPHAQRPTRRLRQLCSFETNQGCAACCS